MSTIYTQPSLTCICIILQLVLDDVSKQLELTKRQLEEHKSRQRTLEQENEKLSDDLITLREQGIRTEEDLKSALKVDIL